MATLLVEHQHTTIDGYVKCWTELDLALSYLPHGHWFNPYVKKGYTDGRKRFLKRPKGKQPAYFPSGLLDRALAVFRKMDEPIEIVDKRDFGPPEPCLILGPSDAPIRLDEPPYDYQAGAVESGLACGRGVVKVATGGGKTEIGAGLIKSLNCQTIWLTHRVTLARQTQARLAARLEQPVGFYGEGERTIEQVTVCMVQTLAPILKKISDESKFFKQSECIIGDEVHHLESNQWYEIFDNISAPYRFGLSATPGEEDDESFMSLEAQTGKVFFDVGVLELQDRGIIVPPRIWFIGYDSPKIPYKENGKKLTYPRVYKDGVVENQARNEKIVEAVVRLVEDKKPTLVLCNRIKHCEDLTKRIKKAGVSVFKITGQTDEKLRDQYFKGMDDGSTDCIVAITQTVGEGVDVGNIRAVINATGSKGSSTGNQESGRVTIQVLGRGLRRGNATKVLPEKRYLDYVDFVDRSHSSLKKASLMRLNTLISEGHGEVIDRWENYEN